MFCCQYASHPTLSFWRKGGLRAEIEYEMCLEMSLILKPFVLLISGPDGNNSIGDGLRRGKVS
jgi:hypothetical protein